VVWLPLGPLLETLLWPVLGLLLDATFVQVPLLQVLDAFRDVRFALALPTGWETAVVVVVFQSLVELLGMRLYLSMLPRDLCPAARRQRHP